MDLEKGFFKRFAGLTRAYGTYKLDRVKDGKMEGFASTVRGPPTYKLWKKHLDGEIGIGIVPIRDDATCRWGALDIDEYDIDLKKLEKQFKKMKLPFILCETKSGGAHLYIFFSEDVPAELLAYKLMNWAIALGYSGIEVFPKQINLASEKDTGNWLNMPYFGDTRKAMKNGKWLSKAAFLKYADEVAIDLETFERTDPPPDKSDEFFEGSPPCIQSLARSGIGKGDRNQGLFNIGVYLRKRYGIDGFPEYLDKYNQEFLSPSLGHRDVSTITKSVQKKSYEYRCNEEPIRSVCNKQICGTRKYGVGTNDSDPGVTFGGLIKILSDPPTWIWDVDGARMELSTAELKDQGRFHTRCMEELNKLPFPVKAPEWGKIIRKALMNVQEEEAPPETTNHGIVIGMLSNFCSDEFMARTREELLMHHPWEDNGTIHFRGADFKNYLETNKIHLTERKVWTILREVGASHKELFIKGKHINVWCVTSELISVQTESFDIPEDTEMEEM